jgi:hypothetical protein
MSHCSSIRTTRSTDWRSLRRVRRCAKCPSYGCSQSNDAEMNLEWLKRFHRMASGPRKIPIHLE